MQLKLAHPAQGLVINPDDPILNPTPHRPPSSLRLHPAEPAQPEIPSSVAAITHAISNIEVEPKERRDTQDTRERPRKTESTYGVISPEEDMRRLFEECEIARDNCRILADSLVYATPESATVDPLIKV